MINHLWWYSNTCLFCFGLDIDWFGTDRRGTRLGAKNDSGGGRYQQDEEVTTC